MKTQKEIQDKILSLKNYIEYAKNSQKIGFSGVMSDSIQCALGAVEVLEWCISEDIVISD